MGDKKDPKLLERVLEELYDWGFVTDKILGVILNEQPARISRYVDELAKEGFAKCLGHARPQGRWKAATGEWWRATRKKCDTCDQVLPRRIRPLSWKKDPRLKAWNITCGGGEVISDHDGAVVLTGAWVISILRQAALFDFDVVTSHRIATFRGHNPWLEPEQAERLGITRKVLGGSPIPDFSICFRDHARACVNVEVELSRKEDKRYDRIADSVLAPGGVGTVYVAWTRKMREQLESIFEGKRFGICFVDAGDTAQLIKAVATALHLSTDRELIKS